MSSKKPPDKYRTIKCSLKSILKNELNQTKLFDACYRTHQIVIHTYQFLRLWILNKYHNKQEIPIITDDTRREVCVKMIVSSDYLEESFELIHGYDKKLYSFIS